MMRNQQFFVPIATKAEKASTIRRVSESFSAKGIMDDKYKVKINLS